MIRIVYLLLPLGLTALWVQLDAGPYPWIGQALLRGLGIYIPFLTATLTLLLALLFVAVPVLALRAAGWVPEPAPQGPLDPAALQRVLAWIVLFAVALPALTAGAYNLRAWQQLEPPAPLTLHLDAPLPLGTSVQLQAVGRYDDSLTADTLGARTTSKRYLVPVRGPEDPPNAPFPLVVMSTRTIPETAFRARWFEPRTLQGHLTPLPRAARLAFEARGVDLTPGAGLLWSGNPAFQRLAAGLAWLLVALVSVVGAVRSGWR